MINAIEQNLIQLVKNSLPQKLKVVDALPGALDNELLKIISAASPAVYFAYLGGRKGKSDVQEGIWAMYMVTSLGDDKQRRVGDARIMGAYDLIELLLPLVHKHKITDVGSFDFQRIQNLFSVTLDKKAITVYAATYSLPMSIEYQANTNLLDGFVTYTAEHSIVPGSDEPAAQDIVTLDQ